MKNNLIKKFVLYAFVIVYDVLSLFWCYIITSNFVYDLTLIQKRGPSIGIIGGADLPTWSFIMVGILGCACSVLFVLLSLTTVILLTVSIIQKQTNRKFNILLCIFSALTLIIYGIQNEYRSDPLGIPPSGRQIKLTIYNYTDHPDGSSVGVIFFIQ